MDPLAAAALARLDIWRFYGAGPLLWAYRVSDQKELIEADARRWAEVLAVESGDSTLLRLLYAFPEFRAVFYYRLARGNPTGALAGRLARHVWRQVPGLDLQAASIGPGLFISHGQATVLSAERIGANAYVHQGVTIGWDYRGDRLPRIGDNVFIGAGAKVLGAVTVGDGARIGANAVVLCDVPPGATAVGVPARVVSPAGSATSLSGAPPASGEPSGPDGAAVGG
jgi:serine O-acetyltransferase